MTDVVINGETYVPAATLRSGIGIGITTHNRRDLAQQTLEHIRANTPGATIVVVDDASTEPFPEATFRFEQQAGIARAKSKCLELLMAAGATHLFLFDDDTWPTQPGWTARYVNSPEPHLCYLFKDPGPQGKLLDTPVTTYDDGETFAYAHPRGCMLYMHRSVVDRVGGMRPEFQLWGHEHVEYSRRIFNAGLTTNPFQDAHGEPVIYSMDEHCHEHPKFSRSVDTATRRAELARNEEIYNQYRDSDDYVEYRETPNLVMTTLLTGNADPQRGSKMAADPKLLAAWANSCSGAQLVVLADELQDAPGATVVNTVVGNRNPYLQRWYSAYRYLREHPAKWVWITDGTDVEMLHEPWNSMRPNVLYVGDEPTCVGIPWMLDNHPDLADWINANPRLPLLNAGVVGGDHKTMTSFCHAMIKATDTLLAQGKHPGVGDMAIFNQVAHSWAGEVEHGPQITTLFKGNERTDFSWWKHK